MPTLGTLRLNSFEWLIFLIFSIWQATELTWESECIKAQGTINEFAFEYGLEHYLTGLYGHGHVACMAGAEIYPNSPGQHKTIFFLQVMHLLSSLLNLSTLAHCILFPLCCQPAYGLFLISVSSVLSRSDSRDYMGVSEIRNHLRVQWNRYQIQGSYKYIFIVYGAGFRNVLHS